MLAFAADLYGVPLDRLLPEGERRRSGEESGPDRRSGADKLVIDLVALEQRREAELEPIRNYLDAIKLRRGDYNGRVLTVRGTDVWAMAAMCTTDTGGLVRALDRLEVLLSQ